MFEKLHEETYGKSGIRRVMPGEYLSADPKGRAVMLASVEKNRVAYVLARVLPHNIAESLKVHPAAVRNGITISSPLEAHAPSTLIFDVMALDVGYDTA